MQFRFLCNVYFAIYYACITFQAIEQFMVTSNLAIDSNSLLVIMLHFTTFLRHLRNHDGLFFSLLDRYVCLCIKFSHKCFWCLLCVLHKLCRQTFYLCFFLWQISLDCCFVHLSSLTCLGSIFSCITSTFFMQKAANAKYFHCCSNSPYHQWLLVQKATTIPCKCSNKDHYVTM